MEISSYYASVIVLRCTCLDKQFDKVIHNFLYLFIKLDKFFSCGFCAGLPRLQIPNGLVSWLGAALGGGGTCYGIGFLVE